MAEEQIPNGPERPQGPVGPAPSAGAQPAAAAQPQPQAGPAAPQPQPAAGYAYAAASPSPYVAPPAPAKKGGKGWKIALGVTAVLAVLLVVCVSSCTSALSGSAKSASSPNTVAIIEMSGTIGYDGSSCSPEGLGDLLDQAEDDSNVSAVVLRINSGGGTATAGEEMSGLIKDFSKPVVVSAASIDASAAYEISSQADYLFCAKTSEVGAIGTVLQVTDYSGLMEMLGIKAENIASAESKDSSYGTRALTKKERAYYQKMVDQINDTFIEQVAKGRNMSKAQVRKLATGLPFTGIDAVENGLFDSIGTLDDACKKASKLAGYGEDYHTMYLTTSNNLNSLMSLLGNDTNSDSITISKAELAAALKELSNNGIQQ